MIGIEDVLRRERGVTAAGLAALAALAWVHVWQGAGMGMSALDMTTLSLFPHRQADLGGEMGASWPVVVAMWWVMMIAMMTPSAAPLVLLYGTVLRRHRHPAIVIFFRCSCLQDTSSPGSCFRFRPLCCRKRCSRQDCSPA